ncbi:MAG: 3-deoxy-manno-octulosonate cytidylyltransferase [Phycisphaerales bacterium JB043]
MPRVVAIIPARLGSTRFPRKVLASNTGHPMLWHVCERTRQGKMVDEVLVATDSDEVRDAMRPFEIRTLMTDASHTNGTSRIAQAAEELGLDENDIVVNVQGDEPELDPALIDACVRALLDSDIPMATVGSPFEDREDPSDPNIVKVVTEQRGRALYFSRALIPHDRESSGDVQRLKHVGLYAFRYWFLRRYVDLEPTPLERCESLEQLRVLEHGHDIAVVTMPTSHHGIDTTEQYRAFVERWRSAHPG